MVERLEQQQRLGVGSRWNYIIDYITFYRYNTMKKFLALLFVLMSIDTYAQTLDVAYKSYGSDNYYTMTVIKPTVMNFITLLSLDEASFVSVMQKYNYFEEDNGGKYRTFGNGSLDN